MYETAAAVPAVCEHVWPHLCVCGPHCGLGCDFACLFSLSFAMDTPDFAEVLRVSWQSLPIRPMQMPCVCETGLVGVALGRSSLMDVYVPALQSTIHRLNAVLFVASRYELAQ